MSQFESAFEEKFYNERRAKLEQIAALGQQPYPNSFAFDPSGIDIPKIRERYGATSTEALETEKPFFAIAGRISAIRLQGKAGFATLQQAGEWLQIYVRKDDVGEQTFDLYKLLDLGDHIGVTGTLMRTRTGELTLKAQTITFLAKAMLPLPDKYSGLADIELRYRRRYLDLFTDNGDFESEPAPSYDDLSADSQERPLIEPTEGDSHQTRLPARQVFLKRAAILRSIRNFFDTRGYIEVETPMLHTIAGGAAARTFTTHHNAEDMALTLRIAPELHLKRLVVGGFDRVYEINRNFRNEGVDTTHNPEFTMLEFYQAYANYHDLMDLTEELIKSVAMDVNATTITNFNGHEIDLSKWTKLSMREAIIKFWPPEFGPHPSGHDFANGENFRTFLLTALEKTRALYPKLEVPTKEVEGVDLERHSYLRSLLTIFNAERILLDPVRTNPVHAVSIAMGFPVTQGTILVEPEPVGKAIATIFEAVAEPHLIQPTIIYDFPLAVSPLSKVKPDEPEWTERFEFYIGGFEVGNAFSELNDPADQRNRFLAQVADKDPESMSAVDEDYVRALGYGLPPTAGEGVGIDRLTMLLTGSRSIRDVILFPLMRPKATESPSS